MNFLSIADINSIAAFNEQMIGSPFAQKVKLSYHTWAVGSSDSIQPPFLDNERELDSNEISIHFDARQLLISEREKVKLGYREIEIGDALFIFSTEVNFLEPVSGNPVANKTLRIIDFTEREWIPKFESLGPDWRHAMSYLGEELVQQVILTTSVDNVS